MPIIRMYPMVEPFDDWDRYAGNWPEIFRGLNAGFVPSLDIYQDENNVIAETPLAGVKPEDVQISIENDVLTIEGKSEHKSEVDEKDYYRKEVKHGAFHRSIALPAGVNAEATRAEYEDGVLKLIMPKEEKAKAKSVKIDVKKK